MHLRLFFKNLFFCVIALSISIHATSSIAENSPTKAAYKPTIIVFQKQTSILSLFAKAVVMGLAFGSQLQVLASPFSQKQRHSLNTRQEQQDSNVCVANSDDIFYVGQNNLTRCLEQHPQGTFIFVERVNFTQFSEDEKNKYPLYNNTVPFSGSLTMFPYSFDYFNIIRPVSAAMFSRVENVTMGVNFTHADLTGDLTAASVAIEASGQNTIDVELDSASVKALGTFGIAGGIMLSTSSNSMNNISVRVLHYLNVSATQGSGGLIGYTDNASNGVGGGPSFNINAIIDTLNIIFRSGFCGGIIGYVIKGSYINVNLQASLISIMAQNPERNFPTQLSALYGRIQDPTILVENTNIQIDNVIIEGGTSSSGSVIYADLIDQFINHKATLIHGMHVNIQTTESNTIGIGKVGNGVQKLPPIYLLAINGTLGSPNHILAPEGVSCEGSMIDWSSIHLNTNNLGCNDTLELETLRPEHWREAHRLVGIELCQDQENCFYVSEDLVALVKERDNSFFLVTRQRYPYNNENDGQGVVRVMQYILDNPQHDPTINTSFAINGTRLFTNAINTLLPVERPLSTSITDDDQLLMLYGETGHLKVASIPLMGMNDTTYTLHTVQSSAAPVQIDKDILWLNKDGDLLAYNVSDASTEVFSRNTFLSNSVNVTGAQRYQDYVYTAQLENGTTIFMTRFFKEGRYDVNWTSSFPFTCDHTYHQLQVSGDANAPIFSFPHVAELYQHTLSHRSYVTIELPPRGGLSKWHYSNESFSNSSLLDMLRAVSTVSTESDETTTSLPKKTITHSPRETLVPDDSVNNTGANPNDNGNSGNVIILTAGILVPVFVIGSGMTAAIITGIACHRKKVQKYFFEKK